MLRKFAIMVVLASSPALPQGNNAVSAPLRNAVKDYCQTEFVGDFATRMASHFTRQGLATEKAQHNEQPGLVDWDLSPIWVISSYSIDSVSQNKDGSAQALIQFQVIAKSKGSGMKRKLQLSSSKEVVKLHLVQIENSWKVVDPPIAKISREALIHRYQVKQLALLSNVAGIETEDTPRSRYYQRLKAELKLLANYGNQ